MISDEQAVWVAERIRTFCANPAEPEYLRFHAEKNNVLPLLVDWTGFYGLRPDAAILMVDTEDGHDAVEEHEARVLQIALFQGVRKYAQLELLLPRRPETARACPHCEGTGRVEMPGIGPDVLVCYCGGAGWLPE